MAHFVHFLPQKLLWRLTTQKTKLKTAVVLGTRVYDYDSAWERGAGETERLSDDRCIDCKSKRRAGYPTRTYIYI